MMFPYHEIKIIKDICNPKTSRIYPSLLQVQYKYNLSYTHFNSGKWYILVSCLNAG